MHRIDDSKFLLYIEPKKEDKSKLPVEDFITELMDYGFSNAVKGIADYSNLESKGVFNEGASYKGFHATDCGDWSSNNDYLLPNGLITNSLCSFYVRYYRDVIPESELLKIKTLLPYYEKDIDL